MRRPTMRATQVAVLGLLVLAGVTVVIVRGDDPATTPLTQPTSRVEAPSAGAGPSPKAEPLQPPADSALRHTELPLRLIATVVQEARTKSIATLRDTRRAGHQVIAEGEHIRGHPHATVVSIEPARLILDNDGVPEQLVLDRSENAGPIVGYVPTPEEREYRQNLARRLRAITDAGSDYLPRNQRGGLLADGDVSAFYEEGKLVGVRFEDLRDDGIYAQIGIREGDVVTSVNGVSMGAPTAAAAVLTDLALSDTLEVEVQREDGTEELLSVPTEQLTNLLGNLGFPDAALPDARLPDFPLPEAGAPGELGERLKNAAHPET